MSKKEQIFDNKEVFKRMRRSPVYFVKIMWGLTPQPLKQSYRLKAKNLIDEGKFEEVEANWFEQFKEGEHISWQQWLILKSVELAIQDKAPKRISIRSGHGIGKSTTLSWLILWFLYCYHESQVPCTAPTSDQMHDILWKEMKRWLDNMPPGQSDHFEWKSEYVRVKEKPKTWFARAKTARKESPESLAGMHGKYLMFVVDEASGVPEEIFNTAEGSMTNENPLFIMISNPTRVTGFFYRSHNEEKSLWQTLKFNSEDSPIVSPDYIDRMSLKYGEDDDEYGIRVLGEFPDTEEVDNQGYVPLIKKEWLDRALTGDTTLSGNKKMMIDPAEEGSNKTFWGAMDSYKARVLGTEAVSNPKTVANRTFTYQDQLEFSDEEKENTFIDAFGVGSKSAVEIAKNGIAPVAVNAGDKPDDQLSDHEEEDMFLNVRSMMFWRLRQWLLEGGELVRHPGWQQLLWIKYRRTQSGKIQIIPKRNIVKEHGDSPDCADMLSLGFYSKEDDLRIRRMEERQIEVNRQRRQEKNRADVGL